MTAHKLIIDTVFRHGTTFSISNSARLSEKGDYQQRIDDKFTSSMPRSLEAISFWTANIVLLSCYLRPRT